MTQMFSVDLDNAERRLLAVGLREWGGPARATDQLAKVMGFSDTSDLLESGYRIAQAIEAGQALSSGDWARAQIATEFAFASDYYGSGLDWSVVAGPSDEESVRLLRGIQRKLSGAVARDIGR